MATYDEEERRRGVLNALQPASAVSTDPYEKFQGGVSFATGPVSTTMPVPDPNKPVTLPTTPATTTPAPSTAALTGHRDQWSSPFNVGVRGDLGRLSGWDPNKFGSGENTLKYQAGGQFSGFDPTKGVGQLFSDPEFTKLFPNARASGNDKINWGFGDADVDVIQNYGDPSARWAWQPQDAGGITPSAGGGGTTALAPTTGAPSTSASNIQDILAEINAIANQSKSPLERQALIDALLQQQPQEPPLVP